MLECYMRMCECRLAEARVGLVTTAEVTVSVIADVCSMCTMVSSKRCVTGAVKTALCD